MVAILQPFVFGLLQRLQKTCMEIDLLFPSCPDVALRWDSAGCRYSEKPLLRREISNGLYHYSSFFIAKGLVSLPFQLMFACIFTGSVYFLVRPAEH
jgi:ABC-type multidrug transport system permease subunit